MQRPARTLTYVALLFAATPAAAVVQAAAAPAAIALGMQVKDAQGGLVGTVAAVNGDLVTVKTDLHEARLPKSAFAVSGNTLLFGMTRAQLDTAIEQQTAAAAAKLVPGAKVFGSHGGLVGTIDAMDDQFATVKLTSGKLVRLPRGSLGAVPNGAVIGTTAAALEAQVAARAFATPS
jgi:preprotein translocase subunit YajC